MTPPYYHLRRRQGVALVIVLCFVVLITGLVVAYFTRTTTVRQLANSSTSAVQADLLAQNASDLITSSFKQEIVTGSTAVVPSPSPASGTVYFPKGNAYAVPQRNSSPAPTPATGSSPAVGPVPNLIRRSLRNDAGSVPAPALSSQASAAASDTPSANGRYVSAARWNLHGLMPAAAVSPSPAPFTAPDWVMVTAEKGPEVIRTPTQDANGNSVTVVGRYAYAVYNEGGLLDANHAGFPSTSTFAQVGGKLSPGYADLSQLPAPGGTSSLSPLNASAIDNLLGWRNNATLAATGAFPTFTPLPASAPAAYNTYLMASTTNPGQVPTTYVSGRTDQMFLSRQQLVSYFSAAGLDPSYLQYLTTFSRGLNQPSYAPDPSDASAPTRPKPAPANQGGNDSSGNNYLNPSFLTVRASSPFMRNDGTAAVVGEPLVKKRFALNRLAWLTFRGPMADDGGNLNPSGDPGVAAEITAYNQAGLSNPFLQQGNAANIKKCFGLKWTLVTEPNATAQRYVWVYINGQSGTNGAIVNLSNPKQGTDVVRLNREPDFFELLKAAVNAGSIAKSSLMPPIYASGSSVNGQAYSNYVFAALNQLIIDTSLDTAILQMGANIIDQFDADNYPTTIACDLQSTGSYTFVYGVENLPFISRVRASVIRVREANPAENLQTNGTPASTANVIDTGVGALMNLPEIWNPHDYSTTTAGLTQTMGIVGPRQFQIYAVTRSGIAVCADEFSANTNFGGDPAYNPSCNADAAKSPGFFKMNNTFGVSGSGKGGELRGLTKTSTLMTFSTPNSAAGAALFREPTILFRPGVPAGSLLASPPLAAHDSSLGSIASVPAFFSGGGLVSAVSASANPAAPAYTAHPVAGQAYIGFYLGAHPLRWWDDTGYTTGGTTYHDIAVGDAVFGGSYEPTFTLACEDGNGGWIPYDNKLLSTIGNPVGYLNGGPPYSYSVSGAERGFGLDGGSPGDHNVRYYETVDPRTSRFGMIDTDVSNSNETIPPFSGYGWVDSANGVLQTDRPGVQSGTGLFRGDLLSPPYTSTYEPGTGGPWFAPGAGWYHNTQLFPDALRLGLIAQNNPNIVPDGIVSSSTPGSWNDTAVYTPFYYTDPDGVARRASGGNVPAGGGTSASTTVGLAPVSARATTTSSGPNAAQIDSRPVVLNRPFQSVAELGYVFSGTPWKNLDFFQPESGNAALLDMFCINDPSDANALTAGPLDLNTRQVPVLQAVLSLANKDLWNASSTPVTNAPNSAFTLLGGNGNQAQTFAQLLVKRTANAPASGPNSGNGPQPLQNLSDLVGRWVAPVPVTVQNPTASSTGTNGGIDGLASCDGFTRDLAAATAAASADPTHNVQRYGEASIRALANVGQTRVWNLMFDLVAQVGRYPAQATSLDGFVVEGEQHYWVHVAIDRLTGQVLDQQVEVVQE